VLSGRPFGARFDEDRMHLRTRLEELVRVSGAEILVDRPPGGWNDLVTNHTPDLRFAEFDHRFDRFEHQLLAQVDRRLRAQAWMTISTIVAVGGVVVAAIRL
jgi:hypothetical protein